jgi:cytoskeletal protein RodZ
MRGGVADGLSRLQRSNVGFVGRHSAPSSGESAAAALRTKVIGVAAAVVAVAFIVNVVAFGPDDGSTTTSGPPAGSTSTAAASATSSKAPSASPKKKKSHRPKSNRPKSNRAESNKVGTSAGTPTLVIRATGRSYVSVVAGDGRTLVDRIFTKGQRKSFDNKMLRVTLGNAAVVRVRINGKVVKPGRTGRVAAFTARRK